MDHRDVCNVRNLLVASGTPANTDKSPSVKRPLKIKEENKENGEGVGGDNSMNYAFISHSQETFGNQEPRIDNASLARRRRRRTSPLELAVLEAEFARCQKPCRAQRDAIAEQAGMSEKAVQIWFQNKRQACRRQASLLKEISNVANASGSSDNSSNDSIHKRRRKLVPDGQAAKQLTAIEKSTRVSGVRPILGHTAAGNAIITRTVSTGSSLSRSNSSSRALTIYEDATEPTTTASANRTASCRLSMSDDGKAEIVVARGRRVLGQTPSGALNRIPAPSPSKAKKSVSTPLPLGTHTARDAECVSHLLSLRSGIWS